MSDAQAAAAQAEGAPSVWMMSMPAAFVLLWSTGFLGAKMGLPYAEPFTFLFLRFAILAVVLVGVALIWRAPWPRTWSDVWRAGVVGVLVHGVYLGGVFSAIHAGVPAGVSALIVGLQPVLTAVAAGPFLGERVNARQWLGLGLGLVGVAMVLGNKLTLEREHVTGVLFAIIALVGITWGTLYQKRHGTTLDLRTGSAVNFIAAAVPTGIAAWLFESGDVAWNGAFIFALGWLVVVLSLGAMTLLMILIRRGAASKVASLFYLTPPVTAVFAWALFGETLGGLAIAGMAVAVAGVALVVKKS